MNDNVDSKRRDSQFDPGPKESDQDSWMYDRRTLEEKMDEAIAEAMAEIRRAFRKAFESES
jgi:hypothetical protein